jgi:hypothetical protein
LTARRILGKNTGYPMMIEEIRRHARDEQKTVTVDRSLQAVLFTFAGISAKL